MCHCTEYKLSAVQVRISEENKLNAATQQFITSKFGCVLKKGSKTHLSLLQSNLQLQNEAALISRRIRAVGVHRASLKPMQPMQLHWAPRHSVWVECSFLPDIHLALENSVETPDKFHCNKERSRQN